MPVPWQSSIEIFARILHHHGVDPDAVADVHAAWTAFEVFLQTQLDGFAAGEDADGFIMQ